MICNDDCLTFTDCINSKETIKGYNISLIKAEPGSRIKIYKWLTDSDLTKYMMGPPLFPEIKIPSWVEFLNDYTENFFLDLAYNTGRVYIIKVNGEDAGAISYDLKDIFRRFAVLDIWMKNETFCGSGYGSDALTTLCDFLHAADGLVYFYISPSSRNKRAVNSYKKAGFKELKMSKRSAENKFGTDIFDFYDNVVMRKVIR